MDSPTTPSPRLPLLAPRGRYGDRVPFRPAEVDPRLLLAGSAREVLARIVRSDPLRLRPRVAQALRRRALFADVDLVLLRAQARVARDASRWRGRPSLDEWLAARVDEALDDLESEGLEPFDDSLAATGRSILCVLAAPLGLAPDAVRAGCVRFHRLPLEAREAFFQLVVERAPLERVAAALGRSAVDAARLARAALDAFRSPSTAPTVPPPSATRPDSHPEEACLEASTRA